MTYKEIYDRCVSEQKRKENKYDFWVTYVLRPLSILLTIPFVGKKVNPTDITKVSVLCSLIGFFVLTINIDTYSILLGWFFFFLWSLLDCIDGNVARCNNACSKIGDLWDTTGGYVAMVLIYYSAGIVAFKMENRYEFMDEYAYLLIGSATSIFSIFPRLVLHKKKSSDMSSEAVKSVSDKTKFGLSQIIAMNIVAPTGGLLIIYLISMLLHLTNYFIVFYFVINSLIMFISLFKLLRE